MFYRENKLIEIYSFTEDGDYFIESEDGITWKIVNSNLIIEKSFNNIFDAIKEILTYT
jgi:hypothetical protein